MALATQAEIGELEDVGSDLVGSCVEGRETRPPSFTAWHWIDPLWAWPVTGALTPSLFGLGSQPCPRLCLPALSSILLHSKFGCLNTLGTFCLTVRMTSADSR